MLWRPDFADIRPERRNHKEIEMKEGGTGMINKGHQFELTS